MEQSPRGEMSDDIQAQMEGVIHLDPLPLRRKESNREQAMEEAADGRLFLLSFLLSFLSAPVPCMAIEHAG